MFDFMFNIPKDNKDFFHGYRHDYDFVKYDTNKRWAIRNLC